MSLPLHFGPMSVGFESPWWLLGLGLIPVLAIWFLWQQRQYWHDAFAFSQLAVLKQIRQSKHLLLNQRILPLCLLLALLFSTIGLAQPYWKSRFATQNSILMLALDISISMEATDLAPNRLEAAKTAAIQFTDDLPSHILIGLSFFAGNNYLVSQPIENHQLIIEYLKSLKKEDLRPGTAIGDALLTALDSIQGALNQHAPLHQDQIKSSQHEGSIILLTDGENNLGISPLLAVEQALKQHVTIYTVGMGDESGAYVRDGIFTHLDEPMLQNIAQQTGGEYFRARSFKDFQEIYRKIGQKALSYEEKKLSLMPLCFGISTFFLLCAFFWLTRYRRF